MGSWSLDKVSLAELTSLATSQPNDQGTDLGIRKATLIKKKGKGDGLGIFWSFAMVLRDVMSWGEN